MHGLCVMWTLLMVNTQNCMWTPKLSMLDWKSYWEGWIIAEWKRRPISNYTYCKSALDRTIEDVGYCDQQGLKVWNKTSTQEPWQLTWMRKASSMTSLLRYPTTRFTTPLATEDDPMSTSSCIINISIWLYDHCKLQADCHLQTSFSSGFLFSTSNGKTNST